MPLRNASGSAIFSRLITFNAVSAHIPPKKSAGTATCTVSWKQGKWISFWATSQKPTITGLLRNFRHSPIIS